MHEFEGGDKVVATEDIWLNRDKVGGEPWLLASKGERMVVRGSNPLEVSTLARPLMSFDVKPNQIELVK